MLMFRPITEKGPLMGGREELITTFELFLSTPFACYNVRSVGRSLRNKKLMNVIWNFRSKEKQNKHEKIWVRTLLHLLILYCYVFLLCGSRMHMTTTTCSLSLHLEGTTVFSLLRKNMHHVEGGSLIQGTSENHLNKYLHPSEANND